MIRNCALGFCAVGDEFIEYGQEFATKISSILDGTIYIVTNKPEKFTSINKVRAIRHDKRFSYHDKLLVFKQAFEENNNCVICVDSDIELLNIADVDFQNIKDGFYAEQIFHDDSLSFSMKSLLSGCHDNIPYGKQLNRFCFISNYNTNCNHFQESFMLIKERNFSKQMNFLNTWAHLARFCEHQDKLRGKNTILGYGEGYSISIALKNSGINMSIDQEPEEIIEFKKMISHLKYERHNRNLNRRLQ